MGVGSETRQADKRRSASVFISVMVALLLPAISSMDVGSENRRVDKRESASVSYEIKLYLADDVKAGTGKIIYAQLAGNGINCNEQTIFGPTNVQQDRSMNAVPKILQCPSILPVSSVALRVSAESDRMLLTMATIHDTQNQKFYQCLNPNISGDHFFGVSAVPFPCSPLLQDYEIKLFLNSDERAGSGEAIYVQLIGGGTSGDENKIFEASNTQHSRSMDSVTTTVHSLAMIPITNVAIRLGDNRDYQLKLDKVTIKDNVNQKVYECVFTGTAPWISTAQQTLSC